MLPCLHLKPSDRGARWHGDLGALERRVPMDGVKGRIEHCDSQARSNNQSARGGDRASSGLYAAIDTTGVVGAFVDFEGCPINSFLTNAIHRHPVRSPARRHPLKDKEVRDERDYLQRRTNKPKRNLRMLSTRHWANARPSGAPGSLRFSGKKQGFRSCSDCERLSVAPTI